MDKSASQGISPDLSEETLKFLEQLSEEDIATLKTGLRLINASITVGTFVKWLIVSILGLFLGVVMFGEAVLKVLNWFRG